MIRARSLFLVTLLIAAASAFCPAVNRARVATATATATTATTTTTTTTALAGRRWNFNEGQSPWGMKKNAEIWNGRVAQVRELEYEK